MSASATASLERIERLALVTGALATVGAVVLTWLRPDAFFAAYRAATFVCLAPALGSLMFLLIWRLTGGAWAASLRPFLVAGAALVPWAWVLALPLLYEVRHVHPQTGVASADAYAAPAMVAIRAVGYGIFFFLLNVLLGRVARRRASGDRETLRWVAPVGLIALVFLLHLLAEDWLTTLDPGWHSTAFPAVWMTGQAVAGIAAAVACTLVRGSDPKQPGHPHRPIGIDWGNLLLAAVLFWTYVGFAQFLIIWAGNLPREISWYLQRTRGPWLGVVVAVAVFDFALPFLLLLSRRLKRNARALAAIAIVVLVTQLVYVAWMILPAYPTRGITGAALRAVAIMAALGLFANRYLALARRQLTEGLAR